MAKRGRPRNVETPEEMLKHFQAYKDSLTEKAKDWGKVQYVGRDGNKVTDYPKLPLTMAGFIVYCFYAKVGDIEQYFVNQGGAYDEFLSICRAIKKEIRDDQIMGGLVGLYNPSITQRLNGLTDKTQTTVNVSPKILNIDPISSEDEDE